MIDHVRIIRRNVGMGNAGDEWEIKYDCGHKLRSVRYGGAPMANDRERCPICGSQNQKKLEAQ